MAQSDIDFRYWANGRRLPLPDWAKFHLQIGALIAESGSSKRNIVTALAVPTRNYAALLVAAGAIISKVKASDTRRRVSSAAHFEMLSSLPAGTSVLLRKGRKEVRGILVGIKDKNNDGTLMIGVQIQNRKGGSLTEWLPLNPHQKSKCPQELGPSSPLMPQNQQAQTRPARNSFAKSLREWSCGISLRTLRLTA